jgi:drug/metabolite transporter (DMT)-like permease
VSTGALALVLSAAVAHALWNLAAKRVVGDNVLFVWLYVAASLVLWAPAAVVWVAVSEHRPEPVWLLAAGVSATLHVAYNLVLQHGYAVGDLSVVYPLARGTGPLLTLLVAVTLVGEQPAGLALLGAALVVVGILVCSWPGRRQAGAATRAGLVWGVATGITIAAYTLWDHRSVSTLAVPPLPYFVLAVLLQLVVLSVPAWPRRRELRVVLRRWRREVAAVAVLSPLAYVLVLQALTTAPVSLVAPARETSIVVGSLLGWLVLREQDPVRRLAGAAVVLTGVTFIALG